jgi:hypothetical protein
MLADSPHKATFRERKYHLERIGVKLTDSSKKQAEYLGVPVEDRHLTPRANGLICTPRPLECPTTED